MTKEAISLIILAAGEGKRMASQLPKCLHSVGNFPMVEHVIRELSPLAERIVVVIGSRQDQLGTYLAGREGDLHLVEQNPRQGTGQAVQLAMAAIPPSCQKVMIAYGDTPLLRRDSFAKALALCETEADLVVAGFEAANPKGYGRLIMEGAALQAIVEDRDASAAQAAISLCNSGFMVARHSLLAHYLPALKANNSQKEYYLTDLVALAHKAGRAVRHVVIDQSEAEGVNTRKDLAHVEGLFQGRKRRELMASGVTLIDPETVYCSLDTHLGEESLVEPCVVFGPDVSLGRETRVKAFSHIEGVKAADQTDLGPFARLRPGTNLGEKVRIGNFVETKATRMGRGAKANHLSYLGDGDIGANANIGAGTIFCNYDGIHKHRIHLGEGAFVGSNSALIAPLTIGDGAYIGSGSVITSDIPAYDLSIARSRQVNLAGRSPKKPKSS